MEQINETSPALIYAAADRNNLAASFNKARKHDARLWASLAAALLTTVAYILFYIAGFGLWKVAGAEIGIALVGVMIGVALYFHLKGYLINEWTFSREDDSVNFYPEKWTQFFDDNFPIRKTLMDNEETFYLYANEETFLIVGEITGTNSRTLVIRSNDFIKSRLTTLAA